MHKVVLSQGFKKKFEKPDKKIQERVRKILDELQNRLFGEALSGDLKEFYSIHFENNKYRLIYHKEDQNIQVLAVHVGKRSDNFYKDFKKELKRMFKI